MYDVGKTKACCLSTKQTSWRSWRFSFAVSRSHCKCDQLKDWLMPGGSGVRKKVKTNQLKIYFFPFWDKIIYPFLGPPNIFTHIVPLTLWSRDNHPWRWWRVLGKADCGAGQNCAGIQLLHILAMSPWTSQWNLLKVPISFWSKVLI